MVIIIVSPLFSFYITSSLFLLWTLPQLTFIVMYLHMSWFSSRGRITDQKIAYQYP